MDKDTRDEIVALHERVSALEKQLSDFAEILRGQSKDEAEINSADIDYLSMELGVDLDD